jgi:hypothetical protein
LAAFNEAQSAFIFSRRALQAAEIEQVSAIGALPPEQRADMAQLEVIADRLGIRELGADAFEKRQAVEAAVAALTALTAPFGSGTATPLRGPWEVVLAAYRHINEEWGRHGYGTMLPEDPGYDEASRLEEIYCEASAAAIRAVYMAPAPTFSALVEKLEICRKETADEVETERQRVYAAHIEDVTQLTGGATGAPLGGADRAILEAHAAKAAGDERLLADFAAYARAVEEVNDRGDIDDADCPVCAAYDAALDAIHTSPPPATIDGAMAMLRFGLSVNNISAEQQAVLLEGSPSDRAAYARERWPEELDAETWPFWGALLALEAQEA